jgi:hypothetical protein
MTGILRDEAKQMVGQGWSGLLDKVYDRLPKYAHVSEVKEKYGILRVSVDRGSESLWSFLEGIEAESMTVCEYCGQPGRLRAKGWLKTLCDSCLKAESGV